MTSNIKHICRVCGYWDLTEPWGEDLKSPTFHFCFCCGVEHGYGDSGYKAIKMWREKWIAEGAKWDEEERRPENWNLEEQLKNIPEEFK